MKLKFFENLIKDNENDEEVVIHCCRLLRYRKYHKGDYICKYGEEGTEFYILMKGSAKVIVPIPLERSSLNVDKP